MARPDGAGWAKATPVWSLEALDLDGPFGWRRFGPTVVTGVLKSLRGFETMTLGEIFTDSRKQNHKVSVERLSTKAQRRLEELKLDDQDELWQLRLTGTQRVWGLRNKAVFSLLWWDPDHEVYPSAKKHT